MRSDPTYLTSKDGTSIGRLHVHQVGGLYQGTIDLHVLSEQIYSLFEEFEEMVNDQVLSRVDDLETEIAGHRFRVTFSAGHSEAVDDLQIYPSTGLCSFRIRSSAGILAE